MKRVCVDDECSLKYDRIEKTNAPSVPFKNYNEYLASLPKPEPKIDEKPKKEKPKPSPDDNKVVAAASGSGCRKVR